MDFIADFINFAVKNGIMPKKTTDFTPSITFKRIQQATDKGSKRSISYWLRLEHDFAYGYIKCHKTQIDAVYRSYNKDPNLTRSDLARIKALLKERQAQQDRLEAERHAKIAARAKIKAAQSSLSGETPYLTAKGIPLLSGRIYGTNQLLIPMYYGHPSSAELVSWQTIYPDGLKRFPFGGKKKGCWHLIGQIDPTKPIIICEGFATGASIHIHTPSSPAVVVAFDAGNLLHVAKAFRTYYPATPIIIAGDNDKSQTGQRAALDVQKKVTNATANICPKEGCDFNDLEPEQIKACFGIQEGGGAPHPPSSNGLQPVQASAPADWMSNLLLDQKNRLIANSTQNAILYLLNHHDFHGVFAYDEFKQTVILKQCPPWEYDHKFTPSELTDIHITQASSSLERYGIACGIDKTSKCIDVVADANKFHSARQYFNSLEWDNIPRLETFCVDHFGTTEEDSAYLAFAFKKWMTAAVNRIMQPGCKFDHVLILESQEQGLYKSQFLKALATFGGECYHTDSVSISELDNKDTILKMQGNIVVELAELSGFSKKEDNQIKNWLTQTRDEVRIPFARKTVTYPRQFVFAATTNNYDYLRDPTGNRRYWPVTVQKAIDIDAIHEISEQLWAEAVHHYNSGLYIGPTPDENKLAEFERGKRLQTDAWEDIILTAIKNIGLDEFRISDILSKMDLKTTDKNERTVRRVSSVLKANGYVNIPRWDSNLKKMARVWCHP